LIITWLRNALVLSLAATLVACSPSPKKFRSTDITGAEYGRALALTGHDGRPRTLQDFRGKAVIVFFGYTHCPDVCPLTLADTAQAIKSLGADAERVQVLFVTVDPERDSPEVLAKYVPAFDSRFLGLYGDAEATRKATQEFKVFYAKNSGSRPEGYTMDHSAQSYILDPKGRIRLFIRQDRIAEDLAHDLRVLLAEG
jgi:protein SCO1/2